HWTFHMIENGASSSSSVGQSSDGAITLPPADTSVSASAPAASALETAVRPGVTDATPAPASQPPPAPPAPKKALTLNVFLLILALGLGFLLASFAARNTDLWLHLATGRALVEGKYQFGVDPFAYKI